MPMFRLFTWRQQTLVDILEQHSILRIHPSIHVYSQTKDAKM